MIKFQNVSKIYPTGVRALNNLNLHIKPGEIYGIIGKSGAGKSTLIRCANLLERPSCGQIFSDGQELTQLPIHQLRAARRKIGMIFQHFNLLNTATVYENAALPLVLNKLSKQKIYDKIMPLLELTGLLERQHYYPAQLSGGQKQRVAIARALANDPKILLCDEATSALDPQTTTTILNLLKLINKQLGLTILLITHEMDVIKSICDRVAVLAEGQLLEEAPTAHFIMRPHTSAAQEFTHSILKQDLPTHIQQKITAYAETNSYPVWRIWFYGQASHTPITAHLIQKLGLEINILQANLEYIQHEMIGIMLVEVIAAPAELAAGIAYLTQAGLKVEVLGYVNRTF